MCKGVLGLLFVCMFARDVQARPQLVIDAWREPRLIGATARRMDLLSSLARVYCFAYANGQSLVQTDVPWVVRPSFAGTGDAFVELRQRCRAARIPLYMAADMLVWRDFTKCPLPQVVRPWLELTPTFDSGRGPVWDPVVYLSPFCPQVQDFVTSMAMAVGTGRSASDGLAVGLRLSPRLRFGTSQWARAHTIRALGWDPLDGVDVGQLPQWTECRESFIASMLETVAATARAGGEGRRMVAIGDGDLPISDLAAKGNAADNWLAWLERGLVDEVLVDAVWTPAITSKVWGALRQASLAQIARTGRTFLGTAQAPLARLAPLVGGRTDEVTPSLTEQYGQLKAAGAPLDAVTFYPRSLEELSEVQDIIKPR